ncbi:hypothetical protein JTB14_033723 [Gonioctena quinquepunctata]|nr:hypothetical protein JTB14_033723 [Gonioctena quinquepunctata]
MYSHGGVIIFSHDNVILGKIDDLRTACVEKDIEFTAAMDKINKMIILFYTEPKCGDFNIDLKIDNDNNKEFISPLGIFNLHITITTPTRITCNSETIIDNIITNVDKDEIVNIRNDFYGLADHNGQIISLKNNALALVQEASIHKRIFNPTNENKFRELLIASDWEILFDLTETNTASEQFYETLICCFESSFPVRKIKCRPKPNNRGWLTNGIRTSCENKRCLLYLKKKYCYLLKNSINQAKQQQIIEIVNESECKIKTTWEIINANINLKKSFNIPDNIKLKVNKEIIDDPEDVANSFLDTFLNVVNTMDIKSNNTKSHDDYLKNVTIFHPKFFQTKKPKKP